LTPELYKKYEGYDNYRSYIRSQKRHGHRSRGMTKRHIIMRDDVIKLLYKYTDIKSILCLGARHAIEVVDFILAGYDAIGIDLFNQYTSDYKGYKEDDWWYQMEQFKNRTEPIIYKCDMAKIHEHMIIGQKHFDAFVSIHSIEHCYRIERFIQYSLPYCKKMFIIVTPPFAWDDASEPSRHDCIKYKFTDSKADLKKEVELLFPNFVLSENTLTSHKSHLVILKREV